MPFVYGLQTLSSKDFTKTFQLKGLKSKDKSLMNFCEFSDLTKKIYVVFIYVTPICHYKQQWFWVDDDGTQKDL